MIDGQFVDNIDYEERYFEMKNASCIFVFFYKGGHLYFDGTVVQWKG